MRLWFFALAGLALWALLGSPNADIAGLFWPSGPAPWEQVDALYYPDRRRLSDHRMARGVGSLDACRAWVRAMAEANDDRGLSRGDYECAVGKLRDWGGVGVYRVTVR